MKKQLHLRLSENVYSKLSQTAQDKNTTLQDIVSESLLDYLYQKDAEKKPTEDHFTFIDLFAGIGGMRLAFSEVGGRCVFSSEWDKYCQETYAYNFNEKPWGDIRGIAVSAIPEHDVLVAGFPCQPFSIAGVSKKNSLGRVHGFKDQTQGTLFFEVLRIIEGRRPHAFLLENVKNLVSHDKGRTFEVVKQSLRELGYSISYKVLDGQSFVPQHRERIFIIGLDATHFGGEVDFEFPVLPSPTKKLSDILEESVNSKYTLSDKLWNYLQDYSKKHKEKGNGFGYGLADLDGITRTLSARYYKDGSEILIPQAGKNPRRLTPRECARLQGFPESFNIVVSDTQAYKQFGNSVVVPLVKHVAKSIKEKIIDEESSENILAMSNS